VDPHIFYSSFQRHWVQTSFQSCLHITFPQESVFNIHHTSFSILNHRLDHLANWCASCFHQISGTFYIII